MANSDKGNKEGYIQDGGLPKDRPATSKSERRIAGKHGTGPKERPPIVRSSRKPPGGKPGGPMRV